MPTRSPIGIVTAVSYWTHMAVIVPLGFVEIDASSRTNVYLVNTTALGDTYYKGHVTPAPVAKAVLTQDSSWAHWFPVPATATPRGRCDVCNGPLW